MLRRRNRRSAPLLVLLFLLTTGLTQGGPSTLGEVTGLRLRGVAPTLVEWDPVAGATGYDVLVSRDAALTLVDEFLAFDTVALLKSDPFLPRPGRVRFYLVRARAGAKIGTWGFSSWGSERLGSDADHDAIADAADNCRLLFNTLQGDLDSDALGDDCDNCPTEPNPGQDDANGDGGGDACAPPSRIDELGSGFVPAPGIDPVLRDPAYPHPGMPGIVHPVIQFSRALTGAQRQQLQTLDVELHESLASNVFLAAVPQQNVTALAALSFVRSVFPLPRAVRRGPPSSCDPFEFGTWETLTPAPAPPGRGSHAMAHDASRSVTLLFGGDADGGTVVSNLADTWEWNGQAWSQRFPLHRPAARSEHAMAWDAARDEVVLFGGLADGSEVGQLIPSAETWTWNGSDWTHESPVHAPGPRRAHAMAYDRARQQVVLFGGVDSSGTHLGDTWAWNGTDWQQEAPPSSPSPRSRHAMAWDASSGSVLLFGGEDGAAMLGDTWLWRAGAWGALGDDADLTPRAAHTLTSRWDSCGVVLFGGRDAQGQPLSDARLWDGDSWVEVHAPLASGATKEHALTYDTAADRYLLFGGVDAQGTATGQTRRLLPKRLYQVVFHDDVPASVADSVLAAHGATVVAPGVDILGGPRIWIWSAAVAASEVAALAGEEPVIFVEAVSRLGPANDGAREAIGAEAAQVQPAYCTDGCSGAGIVLAQWDVGWAAGDGTYPPWLVYELGTHDGLAGRVTVRDHEQSDPSAPPFPQGCGGGVGCSDCDFASHATHIAGTMLGDGTGSPAHRGVAVDATEVAYEYSFVSGEIACELTDASVNFGARAANNSFGKTNFDDTLAKYDWNSATYDEQTHAVPELAVVFAAANEQAVRLSQDLKNQLVASMPALYNAPNCMSAPFGVPDPPALPVPPSQVTQRFFTLRSGSGTAAKNTLVIGGINSGGPSAPSSFGRMTTFSSWGPTQDGRIKPDLVAAAAEDNQRDLTGGGDLQCACGLMCSALPPVCDPDPKIDSTDCDTSNLATTCKTVSDAYQAYRGTSNAAPAVTGGAALLMEQQSLTGLVPADTPLDSDSLKALLIHTATDLPAHFPVAGAFMSLQDCDGDSQSDDCWPVPAVTPGVVQDGPDYANGWGLVNLPSALQKLQLGNPAVTLRPSSCPNGVTYPSLPLNSTLPIGGDPASIGINGCGANALWGWVGWLEVPPGTTELKVTIAWDDEEFPGFVPNSGTELLVNDLDLIVQSFIPTGIPHYSWWLDPSCPYRQATRVAASGVAATHADHRNNVEQVVIDAPAAGTWTIRVQSATLPSPPQPFSILISMPPSVP
jgi:hypothetical protein